MNPLRQGVNDSEPIQTPSSSTSRTSFFRFPSLGLGLRGLRGSRNSRDSRDLRGSTVPVCAPQIQEPYEGCYVAFHRKNGPIGYVGEYMGKTNCIYHFNGYRDYHLDGNKYLFKQVLPRPNAIPGSHINNSMRDRYFSIYNKDGTKNINLGFLISRRNNVLTFDNEDEQHPSYFTCDINEFDFEIHEESDNAKNLETRVRIKDEHFRDRIEEERRQALLQTDTRSSSENNENMMSPRMLRKARIGRAYQRSKKVFGVNILNGVNNATRKKINERIETAGSSEDDSNYERGLQNILNGSKLSTELSTELPPLVRLNSNISPLSAAARNSLERKGIYPSSLEVAKKREEMRRRQEDLLVRNRGYYGSSENRNSSKDDELRHRLGMPFRILARTQNSLNRTRKRFARKHLRNSKAKELLRKTIKEKLLPRARTRLRFRERSQVRSEALRQARAKR